MATRCCWVPTSTRVAVSHSTTDERRETRGAASVSAIFYPALSLTTHRVTDGAGTDFDPSGKAQGREGDRQSGERALAVNYTLTLYEKLCYISFCPSPCTDVQPLADHPPFPHSRGSTNTLVSAVECHIWPEGCHRPGKNLHRIAAAYRVRNWKTAGGFAAHVLLPRSRTCPHLCRLTRDVKCAPGKILTARIQERAKTGDLRVNTQASGIVRHDSHMRKCASDPVGNRTLFALAGGERPYRIVIAAPRNKWKFTSAREGITTTRIADRKELRVAERLVCSPLSKANRATVDAAGRRVFSGFSFPRPPFHCSTLTSITITGSHDLAVKNLSGNNGIHYSRRKPSSSPTSGCETYVRRPPEMKVSLREIERFALKAGLDILRDLNVPANGRPGFEPGIQWALNPQTVCREIGNSVTGTFITPPSGTIPTCENQGATPLGIEPDSPWWEASGLTTTPMAAPLVCTTRRNILQVELSRASEKAEVTIDESEIQNLEISLVQHFQIGTKIELDPGSELGSFDLGSGKMLVQPSIGRSKMMVSLSALGSQVRLMQRCCESRAFQFCSRCHRARRGEGGGGELKSLIQNVRRSREQKLCAHMARWPNWERWTPRPREHLSIDSFTGWFGAHLELPPYSFFLSVNCCHLEAHPKQRDHLLFVSLWREGRSEFIARLGARPDGVQSRTMENCLAGLTLHWFVAACDNEVTFPPIAGSRGDRAFRRVINKTSPLTPPPTILTYPDNRRHLTLLSVFAIHSLHPPSQAKHTQQPLPSLLTALRVERRLHRTLVATSGVGSRVVYCSDYSPPTSANWVRFMGFGTWESRRTMPPVGACYFGDFPSPLPPHPTLHSGAAPHFHLTAPLLGTSPSEDSSPVLSFTFVETWRTLPFDLLVFSGFSGPPCPITASGCAFDSTWV
ncbi:hypothetical protein PR048_032397 [Dryococelus australis]|uniref:Uncharacterized protein n=1 Tax=Dryococelus australis TaxID=614101 RepID=A0ABQ9G2W1_9NEOP|nr:hypothetical protein PR048_032397 [Dryococelus australis]